MAVTVLLVANRTSAQRERATTEQLVMKLLLVVVVVVICVEGDCAIRRQHNTCFVFVVCVLFEGAANCVRIVFVGVSKVCSKRAERRINKRRVSTKSNRRKFKFNNTKKQAG